MKVEKSTLDYLFKKRANTERERGREGERGREREREIIYGLQSHCAKISYSFYK